MLSAVQVEFNEENSISGPDKRYNVLCHEQSHPDRGTTTLGREDEFAAFRAFNCRIVGRWD